MHLDNLIQLLCCIFEIYIYYDFFCAYFDFRQMFQVRWHRMTVGAISVRGLFLINSLGNSYMNLIGFIFIIWTSFVIVFQADIGSRVIYFFMALFIGAGCEFLFGILLSVPMYIQNQHSVVNLSSSPWHMFTMKLLTYILLSITKQCFGHSNKVMSSKLFLNYLFIPVASFGIMLLTYYSGVDAMMERDSKALLCVVFALMLLGNILIFRAFNRYSDELNTSTEQKLIILRQDMDLQYYSQLQMIDNKQQTFIHDMSHYLKTIGELAREKRIDSIISIIQDLNIELENNVLTMYCDNPVVNSILSEKKSMAGKNNINMDIYVEPSVAWNGIADVDLITMLSNLLDNALRAASEAIDKYIIVRMYTENGGCFHIVKIENGFSGEIIKCDSEFRSTKKENGIHGIGIKSVETTAMKYNGYLECFITDKLFTAVLVLPEL